MLRACGVDLDKLKRELSAFLDEDLAGMVTERGGDAKPTAGFQRVVQRAAIHGQSAGRDEVTGAGVLVALFSERESHAVYFLQLQDMTRLDAVNFVSHGVAKRDRATGSDPPPGPRAQDELFRADALFEGAAGPAKPRDGLDAQVAALSPHSPTARGLVERARAEVAAGRIAAARRLLAQARQAQLAAAEQAHDLAAQARAAEQAQDFAAQARAAGDLQRLGAAASAAAEGELALWERRYAEAADLFGQAAELVPEGRVNEAAGYRERQAAALHREGDERGSNDALEASARTCRLLLALRPRGRAPLDWARAQSSLGLALATLGARDGGTARLEEAVEAYRAALEAFTRERAPLDWARTQSSLGRALAALGAREGGTARLEQAVAAFETCLAVAESVWPDGWVSRLRARRDEARAEIARRTAP